MRFHKYHALGNDYLVLEGVSPEPGPEVVRRLCERHRGVGADGVLCETDGAGVAFGLRVHNPDGSEAETSGNGLRIFARYLRDVGRVGEDEFCVRTRSGVATCAVTADGGRVRVAMGRAWFASERVPVTGPLREVVDEPLGDPYPDGWRFTAVSMGNPHVVVQVAQARPALARRWGPVLELDARFPRRTNVQFVQVVSADRLRVMVWERGAGFTEASGSSACAAAAAMRRLGHTAAEVVVSMPGGDLNVTVSDDFEVGQEGPVAAVAAGTVSNDVFGDPER